MKSKEVLESWESKQNEKKIKITQKIFWGAFLGPQTPLFYHFWVYWGAPKHPPKYFLGYFYLFFILFGFSAFQDFFTFHFTMILRDFMTLLKIFAFFCKNLGILLNKTLQISYNFMGLLRIVNIILKFWKKSHSILTLFLTGF